MDQPVPATFLRAARARTRTIAVGVLVGGLAVGSGSAIAASTSPTVPGPAAAQHGDPAQADAVAGPTPEDLERDAALDAYFEAGYGYDDALAIATAWGIDSSDVHELKVKAGRVLVDGGTLPVAPGTGPAAPVDTDGLDAARAAFFDAGYTYDHAVELAALWGGDTWDAKATAGQKLLDGETLPVQP